MVQNFVNKISKLEIKHLKDPGNQKAFGGVPKENKNYTKRFCKKKKKSMQNDAQYIKHYSKH